MTLTVTTDRSVHDILSAIDAGTKAAQAILDQQAQEREQYVRTLHQEFAKEKTAPIFGIGTDDKFVRHYLKLKTDCYFTGTPDTRVQGPFPPAHNLTGIFSDMGIEEDARPHFDVAFQHRRRDYQPFDIFHRVYLPQVFTAPLAVNFNQITHAEEGGTIEFEVRGNPARLVRDITNNDGALASTVAKEMGLKI